MNPSNPKKKLKLKRKQTSYFILYGIVCCYSLVWSTVFFLNHRLNAIEKVTSSFETQRQLIYNKKLKHNQIASTPYEVSPMCGECSLKPNCRTNINGLIKKENRTLLQACNKVSRIMHSCGECDPKNCPNGTKYWRYDHAGPQILKSKAYFLPSIPHKWRIPSDRIDNAGEYFIAFTEKNQTEMVFEYNPSLVQIPDTMLPHLNVESPYIPTYLASFRIASRNSCFPRNVTDKINPKHLSEMYKQNYLGLALLHSDLTIIPGTDVVIDIERETMVYHKKGNQISDFRLFTFNKKLYLTMNPAPPKLVQISVSTSKLHTFSNSFKKASNLFGNGLFLTLHHDLNSLYGRDGNILNDKNFALFQALGHDEDEILAEILPHEPHVVKKFKPDDINILDNCVFSKRFWPNLNRNCNANPGPIRRVLKRELEGNVTENHGIPRLNFLNVHHLWFEWNPIAPGGRGGACCIKIKNPYSTETEYLLAGVGHAKTPFKKNGHNLDVPIHQYFAYFYAFDPRPTYRPVAQSGLFCFPYNHVDQDEESRYLPLTRDRMLILKYEEFSCPEIAYASGIIDKVGDHSKAIISYGINDCVPKIVEIDKAEIIRLLFEDL